METAKVIDKVGAQIAAAAGDLLSAPLIVVSVMRNEITRVKAWLSHYRSLGARVLVIDNGSTDGTWEYLTSQPDVVAVQTLESYGASHFGVNWVNSFLALTSPDSWIIVADADEFLAYEGWPERSLLDFTRHVQASRSNAVLALMLDMYPAGKLSAAKGKIETLGDLLALAPMFDSEYEFAVRPQKPWAKHPRALEAFGGPRTRLVSTVRREAKSSWQARWAAGQIDRVLKVAPDALLPAIAKVAPRQTPMQTKMPLVRGGQNLKFDSAHALEKAAPYCTNAVLLHFKYLAEFGARVAQEINRQEHYRRGLEYRAYRSLLDANGDADLTYAGSVRFAGAAQLVELGLIRNVLSTYVAA